MRKMTAYMEIVKSEISDREPGFFYEVTSGDEGVYAVMDKDAQKKREIVLIAMIAQFLLDMR